MHLRPAAFALLLVCAGCSKQEPAQTAVPPTSPPPADKPVAPKVQAKTVSAAPEAAKGATQPPAPTPSAAGMRGAPSTKPVPAPVAKAAVIARPERPVATDNVGVERIALLPGSRVSAPASRPPAPPKISAPSLELPDSPPTLAVVKEEAAIVPETVTPVVPSAPIIVGGADAHPAEVSAQNVAAPSFNLPGKRAGNSEPAEPVQPERQADFGPAPAGKKAPQSLPVFAVSDPSRSITSLNELIVDSIQMVPPGGQYKADSATIDLLRNAISISDHRLSVIPDLARPSFCSEATYLVFVISMERLQRANRLQLPEAAMNALLVRRQHDGEGVWGRWNANGPGTARLFHELGAGHNFTNPLSAQPGDFLKIWWNDEIGCHERGHSVVFLGMVKNETGEISVRYWSSNKPGGFGEGVAPMSKVKRMLFSRLENPQVLVNAQRLPVSDKYLADMLKRPSTQEEMMQMVGAE